MYCNAFFPKVKNTHSKYTATNMVQPKKPKGGRKRGENSFGL